MRIGSILWLIMTIAVIVATFKLVKGAGARIIVGIALYLLAAVVLGWVLSVLNTSVF